MGCVSARPIEVRTTERDSIFSAAKGKELQGRVYSTKESFSKSVSEVISTWVSSIKKNLESASSDEAKFGMGFGAGIAVASVSSLYQSVASSLGWIPSMKSILIESYQKQGVPLKDDAACPYADYEALLNPNNQLSGYRNLSFFETLSQGSKMLQLLASPFYVLMGTPSHAKHSVTSLKLLPAGVLLEGAVIEELVWRGLFQDLLLKRLPQMLIKAIAPGQEKILDTKVAKVFRIAITAALFATMHIPNKNVMSNDFVEKLQLPVTFIAGLVFGAIKESKLGLTGSIGAHMGMNMSAVIPNFLMC